MSLLIRRRQS